MYNKISFYFHVWEGDGLEVWQRFVYSVGITTVGWIAITLLTPATDPETLRRFHVRIAGPDEAGQSGLHRKLAVTLAIALLAAASVYSLLFGVGYALYGQPAPALGLLAGGLIAGTICLIYLQRTFRE